ncbi:polysaccharide biosynthesis/export family protein [Novosphingobium sp. ZN18A2]|uniref:polysaccharide biosynthesis/export family protein n=1 Tax=Novosphingobium sp. ZN18A2 TaxID=3079861 RepID=UPI0030D54D1D
MLSGCVHVPEATVGGVAAQPVAALGQGDYSASVPADYPLNAGDAISVRVFREPDLSAEQVNIDAGGDVSLPLIGAVKAAGLSTDAFARAVTRRLAAGYLRHPQVSVNVLDYGSHVVTVEGGVEKPGVYQFRPGARLSGAIALASGPSKVSRISEVAVFRKSAEGMKVAKFDYGAILQGAMMDPVLMPHDRVVVGVSGLSQFWQDLIKALPTFALFTRF